MGQRSISFSNHLINQGNDGYIQPEPCGLYGSYTAFPHPNVHTIVPPPGNVCSLYLHHLPGHYQDGTLIYGVQLQHPAMSSNHYNPYVTAQSGVTWVNPYMGSFKQKDAEGRVTVLQNSNNHLLHGNYLGHAYLFPGNPWVDPHFNASGSEADTWAWNQAAPLVYLPGWGGGCVGAGNMGVQGYQATASNGCLTGFVHPSIPQGLPNHHLPHNLQGHIVSSAPQMPASSQRLLQSSSSNNPFQGVVEGGSRYVGPLPATGFRLYRPHHTRHHNFPNLRVLPEEGVAMLDIPGYHEVRDSVDQHRDMRLDIDHMSYEELLALGEQIGKVTTGLSEEVIASNLKTRIFLSSENPRALDSATCFDHEADCCVICQTDYNSLEKIGILECGHEYHEECVKKWLLVKNACPICKSIGLCTRKKGSVNTSKGLLVSR